MALLVGRWKGALVAVKVIDHRIKGNGNSVDIQREAILSTSVVHPNVVQYCSSLTAECSSMLCCSPCICTFGSASVGVLLFACHLGFISDLHPAQMQRGQIMTQEP